MLRRNSSQISKVTSIAPLRRDFSSRLTTDLLKMNYPEFRLQTEARSSNKGSDLI